MNNFVKLNSLCLEITDGSHYSPVSINDGYPMLSVKDMRSNGFDYSKCNHISIEDFKIMIRNGCVPKLNDVLIAKDGSYLKEVFVIEKEIKQAVLSSIGIIRPNLNKVDPYFLKYYLSTSYVKKQVAKKYVSGSALPRIILKNFKDIDVPDINLPIQKKIANVLKPLDKKIEANKEIIKQLQSLSKTMYNYWFLQFDFPNEKGKPYKSSGGKMVKDKVAQHEIPDGWKHLTLKEVVSQEKYAIVDGPFGTQMKVEDYVPAGIPVYEMDQLNGKFVIENPKHFISNNKYEQVKRSTARNGDIIISKTGTLGLLGVVKSDNFDKGVLVSRLAKITPDPKKIGTYTLLIMLQHLSDSGYWMKKSGGSTMPILNNQLLENVPVIFSESGIFEKFEQLITPYYETIYVLQQENKKLDELKNFLLPLLMNGQVTVK